MWRVFYFSSTGRLRWSSSYSSCGIRTTGSWTICVRPNTGSTSNRDCAQLLAWAIGAIIASNRHLFELRLWRVATISTINRRSSKLSSPIHSPTSSTVYSATTAALRSPIRFAVPSSSRASVVHSPVPIICSAIHCSRIKIAIRWYSSYLPSTISSVSGTSCAWVETISASLACRRIETVCGSRTNFALRRSNRFTKLIFLSKLKYLPDIYKIVTIKILYSRHDHMILNLCWLWLRL